MRTLTLASLLAISIPAHAETAAQPESSPPAEEPVADENEILVVATRIRGQVDVPQPPVMTLDENDIASYGAGSLAELVDAISPQTGSGRGRGNGRPVMLVNGQRISSFRELRSIPPEAIRRLEVLPEEVALRFGYPPNQRVINFILKDNFASASVAGEYNIPTRGGFTDTEAEAGLVKIDGPRRLNLQAKVTNTSMLTEAERGVIQSPGSIPTVATDPDPAAYRSLVDDNLTARLEGTWSTGLGDKGMAGSLSVNGTLSRSETRSLSGLGTVLLTAPDGATALRSLGDPLARKSVTNSFEGGATLNKPLGAWQLTATLDGSYSDARTRRDREADTAALVDLARAGLLDITGPLPALDPAGFDRTWSKDLALNSLVTLAGRPFLLPAGEASLTVRGGFDYAHSDNRDTLGLAAPTRLKRGDLSGGFNLALPVTSRKKGFLGGIGDVTANFSAGVDHLSDFGTLTDWSAGLTWNPTEHLGLQASYIVNEAAPSLAQLGASVITTFNVPVYDFTNGTATLVTVTSGGNPNLVKEKQRDLKLSANWELPFLERSNLIVEYFRNRSNNVTQSFPLLTPAIETAFPDRVERDAAGRLLAIDRRPVTFDEISSSRIRWGFNISGRLGPDSGSGADRGGGSGFARRVQADAPPAEAPPAAGTAPRPDPAQWAALRDRLCGSEAQPDISALPEQMQARLRGPDGAVDPERLARLRQRVCAAPVEGAPAFDPERFARLRAALCGDTPADPSTLPDRMRERLLGPDGTVDAAKLAALRERMCRAGGAAPEPSAQQQPQRQAGARSGGNGGGMPFGRGGPRGGRWNLSVYHTYRIDEKVRIAPGGPVLDLLGGDAIASGGVARHAIELEGGLFKNGKGLRLKGTWSAPVTVRASGAPGSSDLRFGSVFDVDARIFINLGQQQSLVEKYPVLKGVRVAFDVQNLFDSRQKVTDASGLVPLAYQADYRDPRGRIVGIDIRKMF